MTFEDLGFAGASVRRGMEAAGVCHKVAGTLTWGGGGL